MASGLISTSALDEDDLEYHVTFPSPTPRTLSVDDTGDDFVYVGGGEKEPVVLLLGWAGCKDKSLAKYSALYETKGCITIRYIPPVPDLFFRPSRFQRVALKLLELLSDLNLEEHPVLFHMLSNGGCIVYRYISEIICNDTSSLVKVKGCVFDSGPAVMTLLRTTQAAVTSVPGGRMYRMAAGFLTFLYFAVVGLMDYIASLIWKQRELFWFDLWKGLADEPMRCPQLVLYSKADDLCSHESIRQFIDHRRDRGIAIQSICWDDSPHVGHLLLHREAYTEKIYSFLETCLCDKDSL